MLNHLHNGLPSEITRAAFFVSRPFETRPSHERGRKCSLASGLGWGREFRFGDSPDTAAA
jgi:hypothetical protein